MKLKRLVLVVFSLTAMLCMAMGLAACGEEEQVHEHTMKKSSAKEATCSVAGHSEYYSCTGCGKFFSDENGETEIQKDSWVIAATGNHTPKSTYEKDATNHWHECDVCGEALTKEAHTGDPCPVCGHGTLVGHTHDLTEHEAHAATCKAEGNEAYWSCSDCGKYFADEETTVEIQEDAWVIGLAAHTPKVNPDAEDATDTWFTDKYKHWNECSVCEEKFNEAAHTGEPCGVCHYVPGHEHDMQRYNANPANCGSAGNEMYFYCRGCGKYFKDINGSEEFAYGEWIIPVTGQHTPNTAYSSDSSGHWKVCSTCGQATQGKVAHTYTKNAYICDACNYLNFTPSQGLQFGTDTEQNLILGRGTCKDATIYVPRMTYSGSAWVYAINAGAFKNDTTVKELVICYREGGYLRIGAGAFEGSTLEKVTFIGTRAEWNLFVRDEINLGSGVVVECSDGTFTIGAAANTLQIWADPKKTMF